MITVNAIGDSCPIPVVKTKKAINELNGAGVIEVLVDNEIAVSNVSKMAASCNAKVTDEKVKEGEYRILIEIGEPTEEEKAKAKDKEKEDGNVVVVLSSDRMGEGRDDLGKVLMKGFIYALTQLDRLPDTVLCYNGGAVLTCEGSDSLEDLRFLFGEGTKILTCGTCLDYYKMKDKLAVGEVTNMYTIVETLAAADKVIRP